MNNENTIQIKLEVDSTELDEALAKERELISLQREYNRLANGKEPYKPKCWEIIEEMKKGNACIRLGKKQGEKSLKKQIHFLKWLKKKQIYSFFSFSDSKDIQFFYINGGQITYMNFGDHCYNLEKGYKEIPFKYKDFPLD